MILWREVADTQVAEIFYSLVVQAVLLFVLDLLVMSLSTNSALEGTHTGLLIHITVKHVCQNPNRTWVTPAVGEVLGELGIQLATTYIGRR